MTTDTHHQEAQNSSTQPTPPENTRGDENGRQHQVEEDHKQQHMRHEQQCRHPDQHGHQDKKMMPVALTSS